MISDDPNLFALLVVASIVAAILLGWMILEAAAGNVKDENESEEDDPCSRN